MSAADLATEKAPGEERADAGPHSLPAARSPPKALPRGPRARSPSPLMSLASALAVGILTDRWLVPLDVRLWWLLAAGLWAAWLAAWWTGRLRLGCGLLLASVVASGAAWHHAWWRLYPAEEISLALDESDQPVCLEGVALTGPRSVPAPPPSPLRVVPLDDRTTLWLAVSAIRDGSAFRPASGQLHVTIAGRLTGVQAGDRLRVMGLACRVPAPLNPGEIDLAQLARGRRCLSQLRVESPEAIELLAPGSPWSWRRQVSRLRQAGQEQLMQFLPPAQARLAAALLLGAREQLDRQRSEQFLTTGTVHILSVSGLHVGILFGALWLLLRSGCLPPRLGFGILAVCVLLYALVTDAQPPVVRASVLVLCTAAAWLLHRRSGGFNLLAAAALVVLALNPTSLLSVGTQLSFLAVGTMIACYRWILPQPITDPLDRLIAASRPWYVRCVRAAVSLAWRTWLTGALVWLVSMPLVWQHFCLVSLVALVLNFVLWVPVTVAMYGGMASLLIGGLWPAAGRVCAAILSPCLAFLDRATTFANGWPQGHLWLPPPPLGWVVLFYVAALAALALPRWRPPARWLIGLALAWLAVALPLSGRPREQRMPGRAPLLVCHFIAVGHGASVLIELPDGRTLLYDAGRLGLPETALRSISAVLWSRGVQHLDAVVISHADADHFNALPGLLDRFSVGAVYVGPAMFDRRPPAVAALYEAITSRGLPLREISRGDQALCGSARLTILHPPREGVSGSDNARSVVLLVEYAGRRLLLTGDLEPPGLDVLMAQPPLDCDVVLAPHHGSLRSYPQGFAQWCRPDVLVVSASHGGMSRPKPEALLESYSRLPTRVLHTARDGCVRVELSAAGIRVQPFRGPAGAGALSRAPANFTQAP